ncbi:MAG: DUF4040 domain-containing protein [Cyanobacteria bacterium P01_C01_bin.118]
MTEDIYTVAILVLLPVTAGMLVSQANPYNALIIRGILGAVAALVYALFGAADVALTEALVGTMLSITLYAVAVRSSMSMRLGVLETESRDFSGYETLITTLRSQLKIQHLRLELVPFAQRDNLQSALVNREIHGALMASGESSDNGSAPRCLHIRVQRLYEILRANLSQELVNLSFADVTTINRFGRK